MLTDNHNRSYGVLLTRYFRHQTEYVTARLVSREPGALHPLNCSSESYDLPKHLQGMQLDGLGLCGFVTDGKDPNYIGFEPEYRDVFSVNARKANRMAKTLKKINARLAKDEAREPGDVLSSLCAALKLSFVVVQTSKNYGSSYADNDWRFMTVAEGRNAFRRMIDEAVAEVTNRLSSAA